MSIEYAPTAAVPVVFVDDDADLRRSNAQTLEIAGFAPIPCASATEALRAIDADFPGVIVTDIRMPGMDGMELFRRLQLLDADLPVILITGHGDIATAVQAMREGAYDFLSKPFAAERLVQSIQRAAEKRSLTMENRRLRAEAQQALGESPLLGNDPAMARLKDTLRAVADTGIDVLILGETGTGKEVVAHELHRQSRRAGAHFVALNCGALPETVIESELFGHEAGAFTGAQKKRVGLIEYSSGGTLFLDEIESMPAAVQVKLLRVLEAREVTPVGSNQPHPVDLRVVAATKVDLADPAQRAHFREDLFHRLNVVTLRIPPLRERGADITLLFTYYVEKAAERFKRPAPPVDAGLRQYLLAHPWPGNVRELRHLAERHVLGLADIGEVAAAPQEQGSLPERVAAYEEKIIRDTLAAHRGDVRLTLEALAIPRKTFYDKLSRYGIERVSFEKDEG